MTWTWQQRGSLKIKTEFHLITAQNSGTGKNYVKAKVDNTKNYNNCSFCENRDETVNHIISKSWKLAQRE